MAVFEVLSKVIGAEELLALIAFAKFVDLGEMVDPSLPVRSRKIGKLLPTVPTHIGWRQSTGWRCWCMVDTGILWNGSARVKRSLVVAIQFSA